jgi:hypothetical protein
MRLVILTALIAVLTLASPATAGVFRCVAGDVFCLIGSIRSANERPGLHKIILEAGTYTLTVIDNTEGSEHGGNGLPSITGRMTIEGAGAAETIIETAFLPSQPSVRFRIFLVAPSGTLNLRRLTLQGGDDFEPGGGAIFNLGGTLTLSQVIIRESTSLFGNGGALFNLGGTVRIEDSHFVDNFGRIGGAIESSAGSLHIVRSTIARNEAEFCGGISALTGTMMIEDSTVSENIVVAESDHEEGGGGLCLGGTSTVKNTTIANNAVEDFGSGGGVGVFRTAGLGSVVRLINVTIADNATVNASSGETGGGGIFVAEGGVLYLQNTILARNASMPPLEFPLGPNPGPDCLGTIISLGNNIIGDTADCTIDLLTSDHLGDARLGEFVDDGTAGGGHIPLLPGSPAIDAGNRQACPRRDQLGSRRVDGDGDHRRICDSGAIEADTD